MNERREKKFQRCATAECGNVYAQRFLFAFGKYSQKFPSDPHSSPSLDLIIYKLSSLYEPPFGLLFIDEISKLVWLRKNPKLWGNDDKLIECFGLSSYSALVLRHWCFALRRTAVGPNSRLPAEGPLLRQSPTPRRGASSLTLSVVQPL